MKGLVAAAAAAATAVTAEAMACAFRTKYEANHAQTKRHAKI